MAQWPGLVVYQNSARILYGHDGHVWMDTVAG
jgi:hypothetical protein